MPAASGTTSRFSQRARQAGPELAFHPTNGTGLLPPPVLCRIGGQVHAADISGRSFPGHGEQLNSAAIIADAKCTKACFIFSYILLASSLIYLIFRIPYIDALGSLGIAWYAFREGKEAFEKAENKGNQCDDC